MRDKIISSAWQLVSFINWICRLETAMTSSCSEYNCICALTALQLNLLLLSLTLLTPLIFNLLTLSLSPFAYQSTAIASQCDSNQRSILSSSTQTTCWIICSALFSSPAFRRLFATLFSYKTQHSSQASLAGVVLKNLFHILLPYQTSLQVLLDRKVTYCYSYEV